MPNFVKLSSSRQFPLFIIKDESLIRKRASGEKIIAKSENMLTVWETKHPLSLAGFIGKKRTQGDTWLFVIWGI
jgi:hypothetical protein